MKKLTEAPHFRAGPIRLADFAELVALSGPRFKASQVDLISAFDRLEDEDEDKFEGPVKDAFSELARRAALKGNFSKLYPFAIGADEISVSGDALVSDEKLLYVFLLLATRLNMKSNRKFASLDGAELFELLSKEVAVRYFGGVDDARVHARVFGTSRAIWETDDPHLDDNDVPKFGAAVDTLCKEWGEGDNFRPKAPRVSARDDKLDVVVWREFSDGMHAKLTAFGQCKTGTHWVHELPRLQAKSFCDRWLNSAPTVMPAKFYFLTDRVPSEELRHHGYEAGVLFERCRVLDYAEDLPGDLVSKCAKWTRAAMKKNQLG